MPERTREEARYYPGPFIVLGLSTRWPEELERRKDYRGEHSSLKDLLPLTIWKSFWPLRDLQVLRESAPEELPPEPTVASRPLPIGGPVTERYLKTITPLMERRTELTLKALKKAPKGGLSIKEIQEVCDGASAPVVAAVLEYLKRSGVAVVPSKRGRAVTWAIESSR